MRNRKGLAVIAALSLSLAFIGIGVYTHVDNAVAAPPLMGFDPEVTGNSATALGPLEPCVEVADGAKFDIDFFVDPAGGAGDVAAAGMQLQVVSLSGATSITLNPIFDIPTLTVISKTKSMFGGAGIVVGAANTVGPIGPVVPSGSAADLITTYAYGDAGGAGHPLGVVFTINITVTGNGVMQLLLPVSPTSTNYADSSGGTHLPPMAEPAIAVGGAACPSELPTPTPIPATPTPTPSPTAIPTITPTPTPVPQGSPTATATATATPTPTGTPTAQPAGLPGTGGGPGSGGSAALWIAGLGAALLAVGGGGWQASRRWRRLIR